MLKFSFTHSSIENVKSKKRPMGEPYRMDNENAYDNVSFPGHTLPPIAPYPAIGYPAYMYQADTTYDEGSVTNPYRYKHTSVGDAAVDDEPTYIWQA